VDGKEYRSDVIIYPQGTPGGPRVDASWWRKEGHRLDRADLDGVVKAKPEVLVVGTGYNGYMKVPQETLAFLKKEAIEVHVAPTREACQKYNELKETRKVVAALHLTC
jgi:hypothetical protein